MKPGSNMKQKHSVLLTKEENEQIINLLGPRCYSRSTTVIQLFCTDGPDGVYWNKKDVGVLCFVRDVNRRSYFFRLYNIAAKQMVWEHEIYNNMEYLEPKPFLHTFEAEDRIVAFNFANEDEAAHMRSVLLDQLRSKERRQLETKNTNNPSHGRNSLSQAPSRPAPPPISSNGYVYPKSISLKSTSFSTKAEKKKSKKKSITKADIGIPQNFRHVSHVGWDPTSGFDLANVDTSMKQFFDKVGISENDLKDKETREFIYDFIEKHGGLDAVKMDIHHQSVPPPPSPPPPPPVPIRNVPPTHTIRSAPPPPPSRNVGSVHPAPPPPPSAPPPVNVLVQRNHEMPTKKLVSAPTAPASNVPPPPPPPPLPPLNLLTEENSKSNTVSSASAQNASPDPRAALMEAIRSGKALKHVENVEKESKKADDSREELLNQIRQGVELKSVQPVEKPNLPMDGLSGALARALAARAKMIHSDSSGSEESEDSDIDEWDDTIT